FEFGSCGRDFANRPRCDSADWRRAGIIKLWHPVAVSCLGSGDLRKGRTPDFRERFLQLWRTQIHLWELHSLTTERQLCLLKVTANIIRSNSRFVSAEKESGAS